MHINDSAARHERRATPEWGVAGARAPQPRRSPCTVSEGPLVLTLLQVFIVSAPRGGK